MFVFADSSTWSAFVAINSICLRFFFVESMPQDILRSYITIFSFFFQENFDPTATSSSASATPRPLEGGYKTTDDDEYTYVRGRGRGRYVCASCGIRCKKPSMLKKHIRSHSDFRPYTCRHCNFSFKTKGNLTKHMKSKAHHKKCVELGISPVPTAVEEEEDEHKSGAIAGTIPGDSDSDDDDEDDDDDDDQFEDAEEDGADIIMGAAPLTSGKKAMKISRLEKPQAIPPPPSVSPSTLQMGLTARRPKPSNTFPFFPTSISSSSPAKSPGPPSPLSASIAKASSSSSSSIPTLGQLYEYAKVSKMNDLRIHQRQSSENAGEKYYFNSSKTTATTSATVTSVTTSTTAATLKLVASSGTLPLQLPTQPLALEAGPITIRKTPSPKATATAVPLSAATLIPIVNPPTVAPVATATTSSNSLSAAVARVQQLAHTEIIPPAKIAPLPVATTASSSSVSSQPHRHVPVVLPSFTQPVSRYGAIEILRSPPPNSIAPPSSSSSGDGVGGGQVTIDRVRPGGSASPSRAPNPLPLNLSAPQPQLPPASITPQPLPNVMKEKGPPNVVSPTKIDPSSAPSASSSGQPPLPPTVAVAAVPPPLEDGSFAPRNVTMNVKDLPLQITLRKSPTLGAVVPSGPPVAVASGTGVAQLVPKELNTIAQMKAAANANFASRAAAAAAAAAATAASLSKVPPASSISLPTAPVVQVVQASSASSSATVVVSSAASTAAGSSTSSGTSAPPVRKADKLMCDTCQKSFPNAARLRDHMNIHYMERPYKCKDCSVSFRTQVKLMLYFVI